MTRRSLQALLDVVRDLRYHPLLLFSIGAGITLVIILAATASLAVVLIVAATLTVALATWLYRQTREREEEAHAIFTVDANVGSVEISGSISGSGSVIGQILADEQEIVETENELEQQ